MTRKRFVKKLMSDGRRRNEANFNALTASMYGYSYDDAFDMIEHCGTLYSPNQIAQAARCLTDAISAALPAIIETCNNLVKRFSEVAESALKLRENSDE